MERGPRGEVLLLAFLLIVLAACGGGDGATPQGDTTIDTNLALDTTLDAMAEVAADTSTPDVPVTFQAIAGAPAPGTYVLTSDAVELTVNVTDGRVFVLRAKAGCQGADSPCVYERSVPELTCSTSYAKGYTALLSGNHVVVPIKEDTLELWVTATDKLEGFYHLTPGKCCEAHPVVAVTNTNATVCTDFETPDCDPFAGTGCDPDHHCVYDNAGRPACAVNGPTPLGGVCDMDAAACAEGTCIDLSSTGSRCYRYCKSGGAECNGLGCLELTNSTYKLCQLPASAFEPCDPLAPACATGGEACYLSSITTGPICQTAGDNAETDACAADNDCAPGLWCVNQVCRLVCRVVGGEPSCADAFDQCKPVYGDIGACIPQ